MAKVRILQSNFSSGELSPKASSRVDIARYPNAAKRMVNVISRTLGSADKRAGTQYIATTKNSAKKSILVPYVINRDTAYMLEFGDLYMRVFKQDGTQVAGPYEIVTPYTEAYIADLDHSQDEDAMFMFHGSVYPNRVRYFAENKWDCSPAPFTTTPFAEQGAYYAVALTLSANTVGTGRTMTAASAVFLTSDVGRAITWNAGIAAITGFTDTTHVTVEVKVIFDSTAITSGLWNLDSSPQTSCAASSKDPVGASITLTLTTDGWRASDVGKFVRLNSGLVKITAYSTALAVSGTIIKELTSTVAAPALAWTLESSAWGTANGYPRAGTLHEQRLVTAGTTKNPQTVWGSKSGEVLDYTIGINDDDAFAFTLAGNNNQANMINYLVSALNLMVLTYGGEFSMRGGVEKPITPTNVQVKPQSPHGSKTVRPIQVGKETLFPQRAGRKLRAMSYDFTQDGYKSPDITTLAAHITETGVACMALQQEPDPIIWMAMTNGKLVSVTFDRELDVIAWNNHETDGAVESIAVIPSGDSEQVWMIVRRSVNGSIVRLVERMQSSWYPIYGTASPDPNTFPLGDEPFNWGFQLDCAISQDDAVGKAVWTGLGHLEGKTVRCLADGVDMGTFTVTSGQITLPRTAKRTLIGLMYFPSIGLLPPVVQTQEGSSIGSALSVNAFYVQVYNTASLTINGDEVLPGRTVGPTQLDFPPALQSELVTASMIGWDDGGSVTLSQAAPFPFSVLGIVRSVTINGG